MSVAFDYVAMRLVQIWQGGFPVPNLAPVLDYEDCNSGYDVSAREVILDVREGQWNLLRLYRKDGSVAAWGAKFFPRPQGDSGRTVREVSDD